MPKVLLSDIAKQLGVSTAVVSLILNNKAKENRISDKLIRKVTLLAREMNYTPNYHARSLRTGRNNTIGLVVSDISNPLFARFTRCIEDEADKLGFQTIMVSSDEDAGRMSQRIQLLTNKVDGFIIVPAENSESLILSLKKKKIPLVLADRHFPKIDTSFVMVDNYKGSFDAVRHLIRNGHKKIGYIGYNTRLNNFRDRFAGYQDAMRKNGIRIHSEWLADVNFYNTEKDLQKILHKMAGGENSVRALLLSNNTIGINVLHVLNNMHLRVPQDIALISYDDDNAFRLFYSPVTVIQQPFEQMATLAVESLIEQIRNPESVKSKHILAPKLIIRKSCGKI